MTTSTTIHVLARGVESRGFECDGVSVSGELECEDWEGVENLFVLTSAMHLGEVADVVRAANRKKHLRGLLVEQSHDTRWILAMLERANLRTLKHTLVHSDMRVFRRIVNAWAMGAQDELIADATVMEGVLFVRTCALETLEVEVRKVKALRKASRDEVHTFEVAEDGAYIYWPDLDVHLNVESVRVVLDPTLKSELMLARQRDEQRMGAALRKIRERKGLRQADIEGVSTRQVGRIERGEVRARHATLELFARAHGEELNTYLQELSRVMRELRAITP